MVWCSFRKGDVNLIIFYNQLLFDVFFAATQLAKQMNLLEKRDRVELFQTIFRLWPGTPENVKAKQATKFEALEELAF